MSDESPNKAGDVNIKVATISNGWGLTYDVTSQIFSIEIYENMFETFTSGSLTLKDNQDLTNAFPLVGNEVLSLTIETPGLTDVATYTGMFVIYSCSDKCLTVDREAVYILKFISAEGFANQLQRVSRTLRGTPSDIVKNLLSKSYGLNSTKELIVEPTTNTITFISNWWNPAKCINYACERSVNSNGSSSYVFFETKAGFVFSSIHGLVGETPVPCQIFKIDNNSPAPADSTESTTTRDIVDDYQQILDIQYHTGFDVFERGVDGYYGSEVIAFDSATQQYIHSRNGRMFKADNHLNPYTPVADVSPACTSTNIEYIPYQSLGFDGCNNGIQDTDVATRAAREQVLSQLKTTCLDITVWGRTDYSVGLVAAVLVPKQQQIQSDDNNVYDNITTGRYLITAIRHFITPYQHKCNIQLMKDSFVMDLNKGGYSTESGMNTSTTTEDK